MIPVWMLIVTVIAAGILGFLVRDLLEPRRMGTLDFTPPPVNPDAYVFDWQWDRSLEAAAHVKGQASAAASSETFKPPASRPNS